MCAIWVSPLIHHHMRIRAPYLCFRHNRSDTPCDLSDKLEREKEVHMSKRLLERERDMIKVSARTTRTQRHGLSKRDDNVRRESRCTHTPTSLFHRFQPGLVAFIIIIIISFVWNLTIVECPTRSQKFHECCESVPKGFIT